MSDKTEPGSVNQRPLYACCQCLDVYSMPIDELRVFQDMCWCEDCYNNVPDKSDAPLEWDELDYFVPKIERAEPQNHIGEGNEKVDLPLAPVEFSHRYNSGSGALVSFGIILPASSAEFAAMQAMLWRKEYRLRGFWQSGVDVWRKMQTAISNANAWQSEAERRYDAAVAAYKS